MKAINFLETFSNQYYEVLINFQFTWFLIEQRCIFYLKSLLMAFGYLYLE